MSFAIKLTAKEVFRNFVTVVVLLSLVIPTTAFTTSPGSDEEMRQSVVIQSAEGDVVLFPSKGTDTNSASESSDLDELIPNDAQTPLQIGFSASPAQAAPGDEVIFTVTITNTSETEIKGIKFLNTLPSLLKNPKSKDQNIAIDHKSNSIASSDQVNEGTGAVILPGVTITLEYSATVDPQIDQDLQIIDEANVFIEGATTPLTASLVISVFLDGKDKKFTWIGLQGGQAKGMEERVHVNVPSGELNSLEGVLIKNLDKDAQTGLEQPLFVFQLDVITQGSKIQETDILTDTGTPPVATSTTEPMPTSTETPSETPTGSAPEDGTATIPTAETPILTQLPEDGDAITSLKFGKSEFNQPVEIVVSFDGILNLSELQDGYAPYLATLNEQSNQWEQVPLKEINRENNTITAETSHFSVWGVGIGSFSPQDGASVLFYDSPYSDLFSGRSSFSLPLWTPPGRNGMAPGLSLSYSSNTANGILGDVQAPWVGMGWNTDLIEIARKVTNGNCSPCGNGLYGYKNEFLLIVNGTGYELIPDGTTPGRYHTKEESFLYIQLHNDFLGNNNPAAQNSSGEWWEVVERAGTRWRLGWNADSEQLAAMSGYPGSASGSWTSLGYAGHASNVVALRWRADRVQDTHGNYVSIAYFEENRLVAGTGTNYDRASYLDTITYTSHTSGNPAPGYSVVFVRESRNGSDLPAFQTDWDNWDTYRLDRIDVKHGASVVRSYDLGYDVRSYTDDGKSWETTVLSSIAVSGDGTNAPAMTFGYADHDNRANCGTGCQEWAYPRLAAVSNGWGGATSYTYGNDGRPSTAWYNWRVESVEVADGVNSGPMKTTYAYSTPCYNDSTAGWCNGSNTGELVGYGQTTSTTLDFDGTTVLAATIHKFHSDEQRAGREYEVQNQNAAGATLSQASVTFTVSTSGLPSGGFFTYASAVETFLLAGALTRVNRFEYQYDANTGNLTNEKQYDGTPTLYRQTDYEYVTNTSSSVWILNTVSRISLKDAAGATLSQQEFGYDGSLPGSGSPTVGELTLNRVVNGSQTIDTKYLYNTYGNPTDIRLYKDYGTVGSQPTGTYITYSAGYDTTLETYATSLLNPLGHQIQMGYDFDLGLPTSVEDQNNNTTTTDYDGLGRTLEVTYPGYAQPNIKYTYPTSPVSAPFAISTEVWDETASTYRASAQIMDGLGRTIQTQSPYETAGTLVLSDISYNAQGLTLYQGLPRTITGTSGTYFAPSWGSIPHSTNAYDALGRIVSVLHPDTHSESYSYYGLRTTTIDLNGHQKVREADAFGRTTKVEEYLGSGGSYTLYATTTYEHDPRDLLKKITDAGGKETVINYNGFGRKESMSDPDMGIWSYDYDVFGNLTSQTDARYCITSVLYDDLNRPTQKSFSGPGACATTPTVNYTYDSIIAGNEGIGHRTGMTDDSGSTTWFYNELGQLTEKNQVIDGTNYTSSVTLDALNRPLTQTLPSGETLNYGYNAMGALSSLIGTDTYVSQIHYNAAGQVTDQHLGNGLIQQACYEMDTLRLAKLRAYPGSLQGCETTPSNTKLDLSYTYQPNGNISQMVDTTQAETIEYTYDELDRLLSASGDNNKNYAYNESGNVVSLTTTPALVAVSTSSSFACGLTASGGVKCWGWNDRGQLGDGTQTQRLLPVDVSGLTNGVVAIAVGNQHACALTSSGGVKCWGYNYFGQLGNNSNIDSLTPVDVSGLTSGVVAISAGGDDTCAITSSGGLKCWGSNAYGQVGDGTSTHRSVPVNVSGMTSGVSVVSIGTFFTCAVTTSGGAKCWGRNLYGNLGDGTTKTRKSPVNVSGLTSGVSDIEAGSFHTCAVTTGGGVKCWGSNGSAQLGDGTITERHTPVNVSGLSTGIATVVAGYAHTCALTTSGGIKCWGRNEYGEVGDGTIAPKYTPANVVGLSSGVSVIDVGGAFSCAVTTSARIKCWGRNYNGQFGNGTTTDSTTPVDADFSIINGYDYDDPSTAHAVTSLDNGDTFTYDENGNMIERLDGGIVYYQAFDAENRLVSVTAGSQVTQFVYDGDGNLVKMVKPDGSKTIFVDKIYEVDKSSSGSVTRTVTYYPASGAVRINSTVYYVLKDHLGSAYVTTDSSGNILGEMRYYAFGETRFASGTMLTDRLYTGQRYMAGIGLYHYNARFYSAPLGRFVSADTIVLNPFNSQDLNRFSYVMNNPIRYTDPSGHACVEGTSYCVNSSTGQTSGSLTRYNDSSTTNASPDGEEDAYGGNDGYEEATVSDCGQPGVYSSSCPGWHDYTTGPNLVCPAELQCTSEEMKDYLSRFAYPGQDPSLPVTNGGFYRVGIPGSGLSAPFDLGLIQSFISNGGLTATNITQPGHVFYDGAAVRSVTQTEDGAWYISTRSFGNNTTVNVVSPGAPPGLNPPNEVPVSTASLNMWSGPYIFNTLDRQMLNYVLADH